MTPVEKLIQIQKDIKANKPKVEPYVTSPSLRRQRQEEKNLETQSMYNASFIAGIPTSEIYFKEDYNMKDGEKNTKAFNRFEL